jgi:hypothetical protein
MSISKPDKRSKIEKAREQKGKLELLRQYAFRPQPLPYKATDKFKKRLFASQNLHALLKVVFEMSVELRRQYRGQTIRDDAVFESAMCECCRLISSELVNSRRDVAGRSNSAP